MTTVSRDNRQLRLASMMWEERVWAQEVSPDFHFEVGESYLTLDGRIVTIVEYRAEHAGYECVLGSDGVWRYDRSSGGSLENYPEGLGRPTGASWDCPTNLVPVRIKNSSSGE